MESPGSRSSPANPADPQPAETSNDDAGPVLATGNTLPDREQMLATLAHDLKNPLSAILVGAQNLARLSVSEDITARLKRYTDAIQRAGHRMNDLLRDLLDLTRLELGRLPLDIAPRPVADLVAAALTALRPAAEAKHVDLTASVADGLIASCDERRAVQVITIVAGNGIKYSSEGGQVTVTVEGRGADVLFTVTDKGSGIPASELPKVFGPYWHGPENPRRGMGVGLPLAKVIVEVHGGRIWAMSVEGEGSTFFFTLPAA